MMMLMNRRGAGFVLIELSWLNFFLNSRRWFSWAVGSAGVVSLGDRDGMCCACSDDN